MFEVLEIAVPLPLCNLMRLTRFSMVATHRVWCAAVWLLCLHFDVIILCVLGDAQGGVTTVS